MIIVGSRSVQRNAQLGTLGNGAVVSVHDFPKIGSGASSSFIQSDFRVPSEDPARLADVEDNVSDLAGTDVGELRLQIRFAQQLRYHRKYFNVSRGHLAGDVEDLALTAN